MIVLKFLKGLPLVAQIVSAAIVAAIAYFLFASVWAYWFGSDEAETKIDGARAGAVIEDVQGTFEDLADLEDMQEANGRLIAHTEEMIARADTQAEKDAIAEDALCQIDPDFCEGESE